MNSLQRSFKAKPDPGTIGTTAPLVLLDANHEALKFMSDVMMQIPYPRYAVKGMKLQVFFKCLALAYSDEYEEVEDFHRQALISGNRYTPDGKEVPGWHLIDLEPYRAMDEYRQMRAEMREATARLAQETANQWVERSSVIARRNLERLARTNNVELLGDAGKAAAEIVGRQIPQIGREPKSNATVMVIPDSMARSLAAAFSERNVTPPVLPEEKDSEKAEAPS